MGGYRIRFKDCSPDYLQHYGIKGQKWGIRRFQNEDRTLTEAGKEEFDKKVKQGKFTNDPEIRDIYAMERIDKFEGRSKLGSNSVDESIKKATSHLPQNATKQERNLLEKISNGDLLSDKEFNVLKMMGTEHHKKASKIGEQMRNTTDPQKKAQLQEQLDKEVKAADYGYREAAGLSRMNKYAKQIESETDNRYIDPSYRKFNNKEEKAKAEEAYLDSIWYQTDFGSLSESDAKKFEREASHISDRVNYLSMDGYDGIPVSERNKAMFDYESDYDGYSTISTYHNFNPKYMNEPEYKALQKKREEIAEKTGYNKAKDAVYGQKTSDILSLSPEQQKKMFSKAWNAYVKASRKYDSAVEKAGIVDAEYRLESNFNEKIAKNVLLDLGYEVTPRNLQLIKGIIWYD